MKLTVCDEPLAPVLLSSIKMRRSFFGRTFNLDGGIFYFDGRKVETASSGRFMDFNAHICFLQHATVHLKILHCWNNFFFGNLLHLQSVLLH